MTNLSEITLLSIFVGFFLCGTITILLWQLLHIILCKKYDELLFKEPYFRLTELSVYDAWPLSLFRSMGYIWLLAAPSLAKKRRFKGVSIDYSNEFWLVQACRIFLTIGGVGVVCLISIMIWAAFA